MMVEPVGLHQHHHDHDHGADGPVHHHHNDGADEPGRRTVDCVDQFTPPPLLLQLLQLRERIVNRLPQVREILSSTNGPWRYIEVQTQDGIWLKIMLDSCGVSKFWEPVTYQCW